MSLTTFYFARFQAFDDNGAIVPGAYLEFLEAGTATPLPVYADVDGNTALGTTIQADPSGVFAELFMLPQAYDINLYDSAMVLINSVVDYFPPSASASAGAITATAGVAFTAGEGAYLSDGSGGLNAGQMYKWDADLPYASETPLIYIALTAVDAAAEGTFSESGLITGLSGLTPGALYYASGTAGELTTTAGTYTRLVGQATSTTALLIATNPPTTSLSIIQIEVFT